MAHVQLGRGREACDRSDVDALTLRKLLNEPSGIEVVGTEVMTPLGDAVGLVEYPGGDLPLFDGRFKGLASELLGSNVQERVLAEPDPFQHIAAFDHRL